MHKMHRIEYLVFFKKEDKFFDFSVINLFKYL